MNLSSVDVAREIETMGFPASTPQIVGYCEQVFAFLDEDVSSLADARNLLAILRKEALMVPPHHELTVAMAEWGMTGVQIPAWVRPRSMDEVAHHMLHALLERLISVLLNRHLNPGQEKRLASLERGRANSARKALKAGRFPRQDWGVEVLA